MAVVRAIPISWLIRSPDAAGPDSNPARFQFVSTRCGDGVIHQGEAGRLLAPPVGTAAESHPHNSFSNAARLAGGLGNGGAK
jgi:hypothetical protein